MNILVITFLCSLSPSSVSEEFVVLLENFGQRFARSAKDDVYALASD